MITAASNIHNSTHTHKHFERWKPPYSIFVGKNAGACDKTIKQTYDREKKMHDDEIVVEYTYVHLYTRVDRKIPLEELFTLDEKKLRGWSLSSSKESNFSKFSI